MTVSLFNGDCHNVMRSKEFVEVAKGKHPIIVTDPPFNIGYKYNEYKDNLDENEYLTGLCNILGQYPFVIIHYPETIYKISYQLGLFPDKVVSWVYNSHLARQHRDIAYFGIKPDFSMIKQPFKNPNDKRIQKYMKDKQVNGARIYDWWKVDEVKNISHEKTEHPCQMPLQIMENVIGIIPKREDLLVIDPYMGSGTTGVACRNQGVDFIGIEMDKKYFEIAQHRLNDEIQQITLF